MFVCRTIYRVLNKNNFGSRTLIISHFKSVGQSPEKVIQFGSGRGVINNLRRPI